MLLFENWRKDLPNQEKKRSRTMRGTDRAITYAALPAEHTTRIFCNHDTFASPGQPTRLASTGFAQKVSREEMEGEEITSLCKPSQRESIAEN
jgi:hypothetical protein